MFRCGLGLVTVVAACGVADDRPKNLTYITEAILAPTCGAAPCHSSFRQWVGDEYDTVDTARQTMWINGGQVFLPKGSTSTSAADTFFILTITKGTPSQTDPSAGIIRMPFDAPMPNADVQLIEQWIQDGIDSGNGPIGAQCLPGIDVCAPDGNVHNCNSDGNIGSTKTPCMASQVCMFGQPGTTTAGVCQ
jgi:hypothetical protein